MKSDFIIALTQLAAERNLPKEIVLSAIEAALISAYKRDSVAAGQDISVKLDPNTGEVSVYIVKAVVDQVTDPQQEITLAEARDIRANAEIGDVIATESLPHSGGRIAAQTAKQVVIQRLREAERELIYQEFADKEGEVFTVTIQRIEPKQIIVELGRAEAILPASEQSPHERYRVGQKIKLLLQSIRQSNRGPEIIVSRTDKLLLKRLLEMEVPEIYNGLVEIMDIAREAGSRSKVAVWAKQDGVDAVGSCVGLRGIRIQNIVNELHGEKIDIVQWSNDPSAYIASALSPSTVMRVNINRETGTAEAIVPERQLSLAIGKEGQNARLSAKLTGWKVDIKGNVEAEAIEKAAAKATEEQQAATPEIVLVEPPAEEVPAAVQEPVIAKEKEPVAAEPVAATADIIQLHEVEEVLAAEQALEAPAAQIEAAEVAPPLEEIAPTAPESAGAEKPPDEQLMPEELMKPEEALVGEVDRSATIQGLPDDIWSIRSKPTMEAGVIRFAEDIEDLRRGTGSKRGRRSGRSQESNGPASRSRKTKTGRRR